MIDDNFVKNLYQYTRKRINFLFPGIDIDYMDISHSVIADERFSIDSWMKLVDSLIYDEVSYIKRNNHLEDPDLAIKNESENIFLCNKCGEYLPERKFCLSTKICNSCYYIVNRERLLKNNKAYRIRNRDKLLARRKELRNANIEHYRELGRLADKRRYQANKDKVLEKNRRYQLAHKSELREYSKMYYQKNKSKWKMYYQKSKSK